jgi:hypothetical protein
MLSTGRDWAGGHTSNCDLKCHFLADVDAYCESAPCFMRFGRERLVFILQISLGMKLLWITALLLISFKTGAQTFHAETYYRAKQTLLLQFQNSSDGYCYVSEGTELRYEGLNYSFYIHSVFGIQRQNAYPSFSVKQGSQIARWSPEDETATSIYPCDSLTVLYLGGSLENNQDLEFIETVNVPNPPSKTYGEQFPDPPKSGPPGLALPHGLKERGGHGTAFSRWWRRQ